MKRSSVIWLVVVVIVLIAGILIWVGYQGSSTDGYSAATSTTDTTPAVTTTAAPLVLNTTTSAALGNYLVAANGMTLYHYTQDGTNVSNCTGQCAVMWMPYTVSTSTTLSGDTLADGTITTITRADGTMQVTYNGQPLYFWYKDVNPGDTLGQNIGGVWFVVSP